MNLHCSGPVPKILIICLIGITQFPGKYPYLVSQERGNHHSMDKWFLRSIFIRLWGRSGFCTLPWCHFTGQANYQDWSFQTGLVQVQQRAKSQPEHCPLVWIISSHSDVLNFTMTLAPLSTKWSSPHFINVLFPVISQIVLSLRGFHISSEFWQ